MFSGQQQPDVLLCFLVGVLCISVGVKVKARLQRKYKWPKEGSEMAKCADLFSEHESPFDHFHINTALYWFDRLHDEHGTLL